MKFEIILTEYLEMPITYRRSLPRDDIRKDTAGSHSGALTLSTPLTLKLLLYLAVP